MTDLAELRAAFGRADTKTVWLALPSLFDEIERLRAMNKRIAAKLLKIAEMEEYK